MQVLNIKNSQRRLTFYTDGCEEPTDVDYEGGLKKRQIVLDFDMATWKVLVPTH